LHRRPLSTRLAIWRRNLIQLRTLVPATLASATGRYCCKSRRGAAWAQQSNRKEQIFESTLRIAG
jgi:hypothetical protein